MEKSLGRGRLRNLGGWAFVLSIPCRIVEEYTKPLASRSEDPLTLLRKCQEMHGNELI
jgi:hypothetical protein